MFIFIIRLDTPKEEKTKEVSGIQQSLDYNEASDVSNLRQNDGEASGDGLFYRTGHQQLSTRENDGILRLNNEQEIEKNSLLDIWQHVLSVGRDGRCLIQSFVRGMFF